MLVAYVPGSTLLLTSAFVFTGISADQFRAVKANLCPQCDTKLWQDKILPTSPAILLALQWILRKPFSS